MTTVRIFGLYKHRHSNRRKYTTKSDTTPRTPEAVRGPTSAVVNRAIRQVRQSPEVPRLHQLPSDPSHHTFIQDII